VYSRTGRYLGASAVLLAVAGLAGCGRLSAPAAPQRIAILRFENLGQDVSADWMGRGFSETIGAELNGAPGIRVIGSAQLHGFDAALGVRPVSAPGVSAERDLALAAGATRIAYGVYAVRAGRIEARLSMEDPGTGKMVRVATASAAAGDVLGAAAELARGISGHAGPYPTRSQAALREYAEALESQDPAATAQRLEAALSADPDFGMAYRSLAHLKAGHGDRAGAFDEIKRGLARGNALGEVERARMEVEAASLGDDPRERRTALATLAKLQPDDPQVWRALADTAVSGHSYGEAVNAYRKALALDREDVAALNQLGYAAAYAGDLKTALEALGRYQTLRPADPNALDSMGDVNLIAGRLREAEGFYLEAARKDANFQGGGDRFKAAIARLMTGDVAGADAIEKQYLDARTAGHDPLVGYRQAQWSWVSGRRKVAGGQLESYARSVETGPLREMSARAWSELAIWRRVLGDGGGAAAAAAKAAELAGPASSGSALLARFLSEPRSPASERAARAERLAPGPPNPTRDRALAYALLLDREFGPASDVLKRLYAGVTPPAEEGFAVLLAWSDMETGRDQDAAPLLRFNPVPSADGPSPFVSFYFPRLYYLRGVEAAKAGRAEEARADFKLFLELSGPDPLIWGEEKKAQGPS
jgi:Flp pilus assembly protein TadD